MNIDQKQDCMRVCYQHWEDNNREHLNTEQLSVITYAMLLEIVNKSKNKNTDVKNNIEQAKGLYQHGMQNGWIRTH